MWKANHSDLTFDSYPTPAPLTLLHPPSADSSSPSSSDSNDSNRNTPPPSPSRPNLLKYHQDLSFKYTLGGSSVVEYESLGETFPSYNEIPVLADVSASSYGRRGLFSMPLVSNSTSKSYHMHSYLTNAEDSWMLGFTSRYSPLSMLSMPRHTPTVHTSTMHTSTMALPLREKSHADNQLSQQRTVDLMVDKPANNSSFEIGALGKKEPFPSGDGIQGSHGILPTVPPDKSQSSSSKIIQAASTTGQGSSSQKQGASKSGGGNTNKSGGVSTSKPGGGNTSKPGGGNTNKPSGSSYGGQSGQSHNSPPEGDGGPSENTSGGRKNNAKATSKKRARPSEEEGSFCILYDHSEALKKDYRCCKRMHGSAAQWQHLQDVHEFDNEDEYIAEPENSTLNNPKKRHAICKHDWWLSDDVDAMKAHVADHRNAPSENHQSVELKYAIMKSFFAARHSPGTTMRDFVLPFTNGARDFRRANVNPSFAFPALASLASSALASSALASPAVAPLVITAPSPSVSSAEDAPVAVETPAKSVSTPPPKRSATPATASTGASAMKKPRTSSSSSSTLPSSFTTMASAAAALPSHRHDSDTSHRASFLDGRPLINSGAIVDPTLTSTFSPGTPGHPAAAEFVTCKFNAIGGSLISPTGMRVTFRPDGTLAVDDVRNATETGAAAASTLRLTYDGRTLIVENSGIWDDEGYKYVQNNAGRDQSNELAMTGRV